MTEGSLVEKVLQSFRGNLIRARHRSNLKQAQLAEKIGVSRELVTAWEGGRTLPKLEDLLRLAEALKIPLRDLLEGYEDKPALDPYETIVETVNNLRAEVLGKLDTLSSNSAHLRCAACGLDDLVATRWVCPTCGHIRRADIPMGKYRRKPKVLRKGAADGL